jgi:chemotaxis protein methyltransferase CheR
MLPDTDTDELEVRLVLEAIHAKYGYDFRDYVSAPMYRRMQSILARSGLDNFGELQHRLLAEPEFFGSLLDDLTVQVSEMFRDPRFYRAFREQVIPVLRTYPQLKVWHAGCASGEEVYTTAILLSEENLYERTQIYATDVSSSALQLAREGVYADSRAAGFADNYAGSGGKRRFEDYYCSAYDRIAVRENLRKNVVFFQHDLVSDYALGEMQVIFCRNVLIYFGPALRERVLDMFAKGLCRGGFLCLGGSESLPASQRQRFSEFLAGERIYRRRGES